MSCKWCVKAEVLSYSIAEEEYHDAQAIAREMLKEKQAPKENEGCKWKVRGCHQRWRTLIFFLFSSFFFFF